MLQLRRALMNFWRLRRMALEGAAVWRLESATRCDAPTKARQ